MYNNDDDNGAVFSRPDDRGVRYYRSENDGGVQENKKKKNRSLRNSLIVLCCIIAALAVLGASCNSMLQTGEAQTKLPNKSYIATIFVEGSISRGNYDTWGSPAGYQHQWTLNEIDRLMYDYNNEGLIIFVDSPGGGIYESDELYLKIKEYRTVTGKPVYASMASRGASGAYYISAAADKIFANRNCLTGSIGVTLGTFIDVSGFLENYGIRTTTIDSGSNKSMGNYFDPLSTEQVRIFQSIIDEAYGQFTEIVAEERGLTIEETRRIADGRIYTARQALEVGLIDEIGNYPDAVFDMQWEYDLFGCEIFEIKYTYRSWVSNLLGSLNPAYPSMRGDAAVVLELLRNRSPFPVSYLCETLAN